MKRTLVSLAETTVKKQNLPFTIPNVIKREPTDLLKALNSTVGTDKTAPHFAFIDDPTTIPTTANQKRMYFLAKELGKRAARQLAAEWPTLFMFDRDYPRLPAFRPEKPLDPLEVEPTEENLRKLVDTKDVEAAVRLFERIQSGGKDISKSLQLDLFHLLAYYNSRDVPLTEIEEWPGVRNFFEDGADQKWVEAGMADLLFESLEKTADTYSTMIAALCKFPTETSVIRAKALLKEMISSKLKPHEEAFNYLISVSNPEEIVELLKEMNKSKVSPSVRTFNSCLKAVSKLEGFQSQYKQIRLILGEMKKLNIEPTLTTYSHVLEILLPSRNKSEQVTADELQVTVNILNEILIRLEMGPHVEPVDWTDQYFFLNALKVATEARNPDLVDRLEKLYSNRKNTVAMTALTTESVFYSRYLVFKASHLDIDELEKLYKELVPRVVGTTRQLTLLLAERLTKELRWSFTKRVIGDSVASRYLVNARMASTVRSMLLAQDPLRMTLDEKEDYQAEVTRIVDACVEFANFTDPYLKKLQVKLHPQAVGECALLLIKADRYDKAWELLKLLLDDDAKKGEKAIIENAGYIGHGVLIQLFEHALEKGDWYNASLCVHLVSIYQPKANLEELISKVEARCTLTALQKRMLRNFVKLRQ